MNLGAMRISEMKVMVIGLSYFGEKIVKNLMDYDVDNKYLFIDISSWKGRVKYLINIFKSDIIYSQWGYNLYSIKAKFVFLFPYVLRKKIVFHWVGTDVLVLNQNFGKKKDIFAQILFKYIVHWSEVKWIQDELSNVYLHSDIVPSVCINKNKEHPFLGSRFSVLTYIGKNREIFYGIDYIIKLAKEFDDIDVFVTCINSYNCDVPDNMYLLGWVPSMESLMQKCCLYLRLPEHDGLSVSVLEALSMGKYVAYTCDYDHCYYIRNYNDLREVVFNLKTKYYKNQLPKNESGARHVEKHYSKENVCSILVKRFEGLL